MRSSPGTDRIFYAILVNVLLFTDVEYSQDYFDLKIFEALQKFRTCESLVFFISAP